VGYDFVRYSEKLPETNPDEIGIETIQFMLMKEFIVVDYVAETLTAVVLSSDDEAGRAEALKTAELLITQAMHPEKLASGKGESAKEEAAAVRDGVIRKKSDTLEEYSAKVEKIKHYIREGHIFQTVLSQRLDG